jgi:alanine racemase
LIAVVKANAHGRRTCGWPRARRRRHIDAACADIEEGSAAHAGVSIPILVLARSVTTRGTFAHNLTPTVPHRRGAALERGAERNVKLAVISRSTPA